MAVVVLVGLRAGALDAAERLGLRAVAVVEKRPGPKAAARLAAHAVASFDAPPAYWTEVAEVIRPHRPAAVVALTERSVVPAAHLCEALGLDGLGVEAAHRCTDKRAMKRAAQAAGLPCAEVVESDEGLNGDDLVERLGLPLVLKPIAGSGGRGTRVVRRRAEVPDRLPDGWMAESFVDGVEMSVESIVADEQTLFCNPTQYVVPRWSSLVPAPLAAAEDEAVRALADAARRALGVERGMTHLEVFLTADGPVFGEMAARPPGGHLMPLIRHAYGFDPWEAVLQVALGEAPALPERARQSAACWILHPGAGTVCVADGLAAARALPGVEEAVLRVREGDAVGVRAGTGEEVGHVVVTAPSSSAAEARVRAARAAIRIDVETRGNSSDPSGR